MPGTGIQSRLAKERVIPFKEGNKKGNNGIAFVYVRQSGMQPGLPLLANLPLADTPSPSSATANIYGPLR